MTNALLRNTRSGNRSEYLAHYLLSYLGTSIPVPRQEDIGIDFNCILGTQLGKIDVHENEFNIQLKSNTKDSLIYGGFTRSAKSQDINWKDYEINWLFSQEIPMFIGICDKNKKSLSIYSTSFMWHTFWNNRDCGAIKLVTTPQTKAKQEIHVLNEETNLKNYRKKFNCKNVMIKVNLGPPVIKVNMNNIKNKNALKRMKNLLMEAIKFEKRNLIWRNLSVPYFCWPIEISPNYSIKWAYFYADDKIPENEDSILENSLPFLITLALQHKKRNNKKYESIKELLLSMHKEKIPQNIRDHLGYWPSP